MSKIINIFRYAPAIIRIALMAEDGVTPENLSGFESARVALADKTETSAVVYIAWGGGDVTVEPGGAIGVLEFTVTNDQSASLPVGIYLLQAGVTFSGQEFLSDKMYVQVDDPLPIAGVTPNAPYTIPDWIFNEVPVGAIDGINSDFELSTDPREPVQMLVFLNGILRASGGDFTLSGRTITFEAGTVPQVGDILSVTYAI